MSASASSIRSIHDFEMSQENVDLAHHVYDAFNRRDLAFLAFRDPEVEFTPRVEPMERSAACARSR